MSEKVKDLRQEQEISQQTVIGDDSDAAPASASSSLAEKLKEKRRKKKRENIKKVIKLTLGALLVGFVYKLFIPYKGGLSYGVCKTFLELSIPYPQTLLLSEIVPTRNMGIKIWFTHIDAFGSYQLDSFHCTFAIDEQTKASYMVEAKMGKINIDPVIVERFNVAVPYLIANPPDLTLPMPIPDSLQSIQFDLNRFRKPIF